MKKDSDTPGDTYPLKLTALQRQSLVQHTRLKRAIKQRIEKAGDGTQTISVNRQELDQLHDEIGQAALHASSADKKRLLAVLQKVTQLSDGIEDASSVAVIRGTTQRLAQTSDRLFQFRIMLLDIKPEIWRRIQVPDCTLEVLHFYIQKVFGWSDDHLHMFEIEGVRYGPLEIDGMDLEMDVDDESEVTLSDLLPRTKRKARWIYEYDFGDGWRHQILFEGFRPAEPNETYPLCLEGARACPPEDCGGPWSYGDFVAAVTNPRHVRHDEIMEWHGPFDPEAFDLKQATADLRSVG